MNWHVYMDQWQHIKWRWIIEAGTNLEGDGAFQRNKIWMMRAPNKVKMFVLQHNTQHIYHKYKTILVPYVCRIETEFQGER
jgi:hypothetical protein